MLESALTALSMVLIIEGLLPLVAPRFWRDAFTRVLALRDGQIRSLGLLAVLLGLVCL